MGILTNIKRQAARQGQPGLLDQVSGAGSSATAWAAEEGRGPLGDALAAARGGPGQVVLNVAYTAAALVVGTRYLGGASWGYLAAFYAIAAAAIAYDVRRTMPYLVRQPTTIPAATLTLGAAYHHPWGWYAAALTALVLAYTTTQMPRAVRPWATLVAAAAAAIFGAWVALVVILALWLAAKYRPARPYTLPTGFGGTNPPPIGGKRATTPAEGRKIAGAYGELCTAWHLLGLPRGGYTIHDVVVPKPGTTANVDHIAVTRGRVWVLDSKQVRGTVYTNAQGVLCRTYQGKPDAPLTDTLDTTCWEADAVHEATGIPVQVALVVAGGTLRGTTAGRAYLTATHKGRTVYITTPKEVCNTLAEVGALVPAVPAATARLWWARGSMRAAAAGRDPVANTTWGMG